MPPEVAAPSSPAADKLAAARTKLILDKPFLGALVLRLPLVEAGAWCRTTGTDARKLYYNPQWIDSLTTAEVQFALAHEALHCALGHFARRGHRVQRKWDLACDFAINPLLMDEGLKPPLGSQVLDLYRGMAAEEIYPCIDDELDNETLDDHVWDGDDGGQGGGGGEQDDVQGKGGSDPQEIDPDAGGATPQKAGAGGTAGDGPDGPPPPLSAKEKEQLQNQWQRHLAAAAQRAREAGKLSGNLARLTDTALAPQVSWRAALAQYLSQAARDDYTWLRPSRREGDVIWPSLRSHSGEIFIALDTSGSIADADLAQFVGELNAIKGTLPVRITLFACDSDLHADTPWICEPWEEFRLPRKFEGGGGTAFAPVFDWVEKSGGHPDALVYFTDAEGEFPKVAPNYPVLWLIKGKAPVPWGRRIQLN
ncbi:putative metal-dependent peptidase [Sulfurisoma sediminicola]|uniref:Putative metal-dependent peptidase n=1 Tax=Sulfurisoma sediminicola TaxID=1381557 RepID=A0A497XJS6_9PROT|nr:putative metal-dependent peptidase [Sulfurisoma sediminicola]